MKESLKGSQVILMYEVGTENVELFTVHEHGFGSLMLRRQNNCVRTNGKEALELLQQ